MPNRKTCFAAGSTVHLILAGVLALSMPTHSQDAKHFETIIQNRGVRQAISDFETTLLQNPEDRQALEMLKRVIWKGDLVAREESLRLRRLVREYSRHSRTWVAPPEELGQRLIVSGTVRNVRGEPVAGALVYVFQTDANGYYTPQDSVTGGMDEPNSRIFGYMRTGRDGRYEFSTVRPGGYPGVRKDASGQALFIPQHIHLLVTAEGYRDYGCRSTCQLVFEDDPRMTARWRRWAEEGGNPILKVEHGADGIQSTVYDITLQPL